MKWPLLGLAGLSCSLTSPALAQGVTVSTGPATTVIEGLIACGRRVRPSAVGEITSENGALRVLPAETHFTTGPKAADLYNACADFEPAS